MTYEAICATFGARGAGDKRKCRCPAHADKQASLSLSRGANGKTLLHCHAGCSLDSILAAKHLELSDLYAEDKPFCTGSAAWMRSVETSMQRKTGKALKIEAVYDYRDLNGAYAYTKVRMTGKNMVYGILKDGHFTFGLGGKSRREWGAIFTEDVTKFKEAAARGERVFYAEGEKDVLTLQAHGCLAATAGGASDWDGNLSQAFEGADVVLCADNDDPGLKLARQVESDLKGIASSVTVIVPTPNLPHGDITDFFQSGKTDEDLQQLINASRAGGAPSEQRDQRNDLDQFHHVGRNGQITGVFDWAIFQHLTKREHIMIVGGTPYIYENGVYRADPSGANLKTMIRDLIYPDFIKSNVIRRVYELFLSAAELQVRMEDLNAYPAHWINFENGMFDPISRRLLPHDPKYRAINQIPHSFDPDAEPEGRELAAWLRSTFPDADDLEMLLQYVGLCMTRDTRQQKFLLIHGLGGTGKSGLIGLIGAIVGDENACHVPLEKLSERFTAFELMGKLLNSCADLKITALEDVSVLKQVLGEDALRGEAKGKDGVNFRSYARMVFSTNELPTVRNERTNGFYRRLLVLTMNRIPEAVDPDLFVRLWGEIQWLIHQAVDALGRMYAAGRIIESENSKAAVAQMELDSDSVEAWISEQMYRVPDARATRSILFDLYSAYCYDNDRQALQKNNFFKALRSKGYSEVKGCGTWCFVGLTQWKPLTKSAEG